MVLLHLPYLCFLEIASVSILMLSAKQGNHWYHVNVFGMPRHNEAINCETNNDDVNTILSKSKCTLDLRINTYIVK